MKPFSLVDRKPSSSRTPPRAPAEHHPLSPPDTESLSSHVDPYSMHLRRPSLAHTDSTYTHSMLPTIPATPDAQQESAGARFRRLAGIPTTQSGSREFRGASRPQTRWLLVLMPPAHLATELAVGHRSPGRLSSGLLIPLFPTLFAQLTAIAKEFSLPSTTGLCLYLHLPEVPNAPRITDEAWPLLWGRHLHTDDAALPLGLPVAGRVEFDIDVPNARWFPMWFAHVSRQELVPDLALAIPLSPRALAKSTSPDEPTRAAKSIPRPLALAPRAEPAISVQVDSGPSPVPSPSKPTIPKSASKETVDKVRRWSALVTPDPALRVPEPTPPKTEEKAVTEEASEHEELPLNLEDFQWSISSAGPPSPTSSHATSASSRVRSIHLLERAEGSVLLTPTTATSWGPPDHSDIGSELDIGGEWRVRSPDLGERAEGSVPLTPSTATSWGAPLSYPPTPAQWIAMHELVRSPDLGQRAEGSVLLTPSTATTWGAPLSYPPTPAQWHALQQHIRSPDLGQRAEGSVVLTPSTATSWGAPLSYPPTPQIWLQAEQRWVASPDVGARAFSPGATAMSPVRWGTEVETEQEAYARMGLEWRWEFGWPYDSASAGPSGNPDLAAQAIPEVDEDSVSGYAEGPEVHVTQHEDVQGETFEFGWPRFEGPASGQERSLGPAVHSGGSALIGVSAVGAEAEVFEYSFPHFEPPTPAPAANVAATIGAPRALKAQVPAPAQVQTRSYGAYPYLVLYPSTYPHLDLYPTAAAATKVTPARPVLSVATQSIGAGSLAGSIASLLRERSASVASFVSSPGVAGYALSPDESVPSPADILPSPVDILPSPVESVLSAVYSFPSRAGSTSARSQADSPSSSPISRLGARKRGLSVLVPNVSDPSVVAVNPADIHGRSQAWSRALPPVPPMPRMDSMSTRKGSVGEGSVRGGSVRGSSREAIVRGSSLGGSVRGPSRERSVAAIPPRLQQLERRPSIVFDDTEFGLLPSQKKPALSSAYPHRYPHNLGQLYPAVRTLGYPVSLANIYPSVSESSVPAAKAVVAEAKKETVGLKQLDGSLGARPAAAPQPTTRANVKTKAIVYPVFDLYPAVYPHNLVEIYPAVAGSRRVALASVPTTSRSAPTPAPSAPVPAPPAPARATEAKKEAAHPAAAPEPTTRANVKTKAVVYPVFDLYPAVYPHNLVEIYPAVAGSRRAAPAPAPTPAPSAPVPAPPAPARATEAKKEAAHPVAAPEPTTRANVKTKAVVYPVFDLYPAVYPYNLVEIYPAVTGSRRAALASVPTTSRSAPTPAPSAPVPAPPAPARATEAKKEVVGLKQLDGSLAAHPAAAPESATRANVKTKAVVYPVFDLYPAVYPYNLVEIYPAVAGSRRAALASVPTTSRSAPTPTPAPSSPVPAPARATETSVPAASTLASSTQPSAVQHVKMSRGYPFIDPYPAVYPHNLESIYPITRTQAATEVAATVASKPVKTAAQALSGIHVRLSPQYPTLELFPAVYPYNLERIYPTANTLVPALSNAKSSQTPEPKPTPSVVKVQKPVVADLSAREPRAHVVRGTEVRLARTYPNMELYAPVYPFNLDIYPVVARKGVVVPKDIKATQADTVVVAAQAVHLELVDKEVTRAATRPRKTHAKLCVEAWRKTHVQLVAEVAAEATPARTHKSHAKLHTEVFPDGLLAPTPTTQSPHVTVTPAQFVAPEPEPAAKPAVAPLRRQRSGTIMARPPPAGPLPPPPALPQGIDLGRSRSMLEARTQMFERAAPARSNTVGAPRIVRQKSPSFERAKSLFHTPEESGAESEGTRTPPRAPRRTVSKLDMSKFNFS